MYTQFGTELSRASRLRLPGVDVSLQRWSSLYSANREKFLALKEFVRSRPNIVVLGAGCGYSLNDLPPRSDGWSYAGVHWMPFHPGLNMDIVLSNHTCALDAALRAPSSNNIQFFIQSSGEIVPPIFERALSIQWGNINSMTSERSPSGIVSYIDATIASRVNSPVPFFPAQPNVIFVLSTLLIYCGAEKLVFAGVDPLNPVHFYANNPEVQLSMASAQCLADPWIGEWDGSSKRLSVLHRDTSYRVLEYVKDLLFANPSLIGDPKRLEWFHDGFDIIKSVSSARSVELAYVGHSKFMESIDMANL